MAKHGISYAQLTKENFQLRRNLNTCIQNATALFNERTELCLNPDSEKSAAIRKGVLLQVEKLKAQENELKAAMQHD